MNELLILVDILPNMVGFAITVFVMREQIRDLKEIVYILFDRVIPDDEDSIEIVNFSRRRDEMLAEEARKKEIWDASKDL